MTFKFVLHLKVQEKWPTQVDGCPFSEYHLSRIIYIMDYCY